MKVLHWDDAPFGTGFAVSRFKSGPYKGDWGILVSLPDNQWAWIALGDPAEIVVGPNEELVQSVLTNLRSFAKMKKAAEDMGSWENNDPSGLPHPGSFPVISWDEVPESVRLQERQFLGRIWGIVALLPDGEHLVTLGSFAREAGYHTFGATQEEVQGTIAWLEMTQTPPDPAPTPPFVPEGEPPVLSDFDEREHFADILVAINEYSKKDRERIATLEQEWRRRLKEGNRRSCLCGQCRHEIRHKVIKILDWYEESMGYIPSELRLDSLRLLDLLARK